MCHKETLVTDYWNTHHNDDTRVFCVPNDFCKGFQFIFSYTLMLFKDHLEI